MTSGSSFSKLLGSVVRRNLWAIILTFTGSFFAVTLPVIMEIQSFSLSYTKADVLAYNDLLATLQASVSVANLFATCGLTLMAVLCSLKLFSYLHSKKQVDFYFSLPIKRNKIFSVHFFGGILTVLPAFFVHILLSCAVIAAAGYGEALHADVMLYSACSFLVYFLVIYAIGVLSAVLCGNTVVAGALSIWFYFSPAGLIALWTGIQDIFYQTFLSDQYLTEVSYYSSPVLSFLRSSAESVEYYPGAVYSAPPASSAPVRALVIYAIVFVLLSVLAAFLHKIRRGEAAACAVAFDKIRLPFKLYMCLVSAFGLGYILHGQDGNIWLYIGFAIGALVCHCVVEVIYEFDIHCLFKRLWQLAIFGAAAVVLFVCLEQDVTQFDTKLPRYDNIQTVEFTDNAFQAAIYPYERTALEAEGANGLSEQDNIDLAYRISQLAVEYLEEHPDSAEIQPASSAAEIRLDAAESSTAPVSVELIFHYQSGGRFARQYVLPSAEIDRLARELTYTEEYRTKYHPLFAYDRDSETYTLELSDLYGNNAYPILEDRETVQRFLDTMAAEYASVGRDYLDTAVPVASICFSTDRSAHFVAVYPRYVNTLGLMEELFGYNPYVYTAEDVSYIEITQYFIEYEDDAVSYNHPELHTITAPEDIQAIFPYAIPSSILYSGEDYPLPLASHPDLDVCVYFHDGTSCLVDFLEGQYPASLLHSYL